jgi:hypothetical protein
MRSGFIRSGTAQPSRRNSGFEDYVEFSGFVVALDRVRNLLAGLDRDGRFIHDHAILAGFEHPGDLSRDSLDIGEIDRAVDLRRGRHGDEDDLAVIDASSMEFVNRSRFAATFR